MNESGFGHGKWIFIIEDVSSVRGRCRSLLKVFGIHFREALELGYFFLDFSEEAKFIRKTCAAMEQEVLIQVTDSTPYKPPPFTCSHMTKWRRRSTDELSYLPIHALKQLKKELNIIIQEASGELVGLLQERHTLQEEVDIRSVTIEQLLKFAERRQLQLGEPLAIQMSVVRNHCQEASSESGLG